MSRALVVAAIVPPWQGADEPTYVAYAQVLALPDAIVDGSPLIKRPAAEPIVRVEEDIQRQVIESMAAHDWWDAYGQVPPDPLPAAFSQIGRPAGNYSQPLYYGLAALVLRFTHPEDIDGAYFRLRALSVVLSVGVLLMGWAGTRLLLGPAVAIGATTVGALHPQFVLSAISPNPDTLAAFWGAFAWWQLGSLVAGRRRALAVALLLVATVAALLTKRSAVPLAAVTLLCAAAMFVPTTWRSTPRRRVLAVVTLSGLIVMTAATYLLFGDVFAGLGLYWRSTFTARRAFSSRVFVEMFDYLTISVDYAWLMAGWQRFAPERWWLLVARTLTVVALAGALARTWKSERRVGLAIAWFLLGVQVAAVVGPGFMSLAAPQGRYLFPAFAPMMAILWVGVVGLHPGRVWPYAALALIIIVAGLDATGTTTVLLRAYVPEMLRVL